MEVFVLGFEKKTKIPFCFLITTTRFIQSKNSIDVLYKKYEGLEIEESNYRAAGADQIKLHFTNLKEFRRMLLNEREIINSVKEMNLRLMRKGGTIYSSFHCFDLANNIAVIPL